MPAQLLIDAQAAVTVVKRCDLLFQGANVTIVARNAEKLQQAKREIEEMAESLSPEESVFNPQVRTFVSRLWSPLEAFLVFWFVS